MRFLNWFQTEKSAPFQTPLQIVDWFASYKEIAKWVGRGAEYISLQSFGTKSSLEPFDSKELLAFPAKNGGDKRDRTADLLNAILG